MIAYIFLSIPTTIFLMYQFSRCYYIHQLKQNIIKLEVMKKVKNEPLQNLITLIDSHKEQLRKLEGPLLNRLEGPLLNCE